MCSIGAFAVGLGIASKVNQADLEGEMQTSNIYQQMEINRIKAQETLSAGRIAEEAKRIETRKALGAQNAAMAASGFQTGTGTFERIKEDTAKTGELDARTIQRNAMLQAWGYEAENAMLFNKAKYTSKITEAKKWGSVLGGAGTLLGGFGG